MNFSRKYLHRVCFLYVNLSTSPSDHFCSYSSVHNTKALFSFLILCFFLCWVFMLLLLLLLDDSALTVSLRQCAAPKASTEVILHRLRKQEYKVIGLTNTNTHTHTMAGFFHIWRILICSFKSCTYFPLIKSVSINSSERMKWNVQELITHEYEYYNNYFSAFH